MKQFFFTLGILLSSLLVTAQDFDLDAFNNMKPRSLGPAGMSGRVTSIDVVLNDPDIIYIGTASGGVWKSESGGIDWEPLFDDQATLNIGAIAIQQSNPDVIWAGTGEGNPRNSQSSGGGIYKSLDGGRTWKMMGLEKTITIHRIIVHRDNPDVVFVAATGSAWGPHPERGVYKTTDGGNTWEHILKINDSTGCADLVVDPQNPNKLIAAMWEYGRKPWFFESGGEGSGMYLTVDGGENWTQITEKHGLPKGTLGRMGLAIAPSNPDIIYALVEAKKNGLYKSTDGGYHWSLVSEKNIGNRPFYYADIYVDPQNENRIYNLYSLVSKSEDGGKTFEVLLPYSGVHPDHHAFWIHPEDPDYLIDGNDGGLNISRDRGKSWRFIENLPLAQFYHINHDMDIPYNIYGGMQDNGSWRGPAYIWQQGGIINTMWQGLVFGDGFDVVPQPNDSRYGYAMYQGGNVYRYDAETGKNTYIQPMHPEGTPLRFNWNAAVTQDPKNDCGVYFGSQFVHYSNDCGSTWEILSPDLTTNDTAKQKQAQSGGLTIDATRAENYTSILCISPSSLDENVLWVGTDDGNLQVTKDRGQNWQNVMGKLKDAPEGGWIPQIHASVHHAGEAYVVINNYRQNDWKPYVYKTTDYGQKWTRIADENNVDGHALSIVQDPVAPNLLFLGTERGLYFSLDGGSTWTKWTNGYPSVSTMDLKIHPREHDLIIGTFGRSAWVLDNILPLREIALKGQEILDEQLLAFPTPDAHLASYRSQQGVIFGADAFFRGENRGYGAQLTCWFNPALFSKEKKEKTEGEEKPKGKKKGQGGDKAQVFITNATGDTIRRMTFKPDTGLNKYSWNLSRDGVRYPSWRTPKPDAWIPSGLSVSPGTYTVNVSWKGYETSTTVKVLPDPRMPYAEADEEYRAQLVKRYEASVTGAATAFEHLKSVQKMISNVNQQLANVDEDVAKELKKQGKALMDSIGKMQDWFMLPKDFDGYDHVTVRLNQRLGRASSYLNSGQGRPSKTAEIALKEAEAETQRIVDIINAWLETAWKDYQKAVEAANPSLFKPLEPVKIEE